MSNPATNGQVNTPAIITVVGDTATPKLVYIAFTLSLISTLLTLSVRYGSGFQGKEHLLPVIMGAILLVETGFLGKVISDRDHSNISPKWIGYAAICPMLCMTVGVALLGMMSG